MQNNALLDIQTQLFAGPRIKELCTPEDIFLRAPTAPGLGLELDSEMAERTLIAG